MEHANGQKRRRLNETPQQTEMRRAADANRHRRRYVSVAQKRSDYWQMKSQKTIVVWCPSNVSIVKLTSTKNGKMTRSSIKNPKFGLCCGDGKVKLRAVADPQNLSPHYLDRTSRCGPVNASPEMRLFKCDDQQIRISKTLLWGHLANGCYAVESNSLAAWDGQTGGR
jgi:hypothetical protein